MAFADQRELKKIAIGKQRGADHHTSPILQRVDGDAPYLRLTVAKIVEMTLAREAGNAVFAAESDVHVSPPVLKIAGAEYSLARQ
jgi:hypothetical protein